MKIIISHDVDHLYASDHYLKDLIIPKLWGRSFIHLCKGKINFKTFFNRLFIVFDNRMNRIDELMEFDKKNNIPSVFFFGMNNGLGMSYSQKKAKPIIKKVYNNGFDIGVHGIDFENADNIKKEHDDFKNLSEISAFGIRNHYVRFNDETFEKMNRAGYLFDSTWFNKKELDIRAPYKVGNMWEFPLHIMDGYICKPGTLARGIEDTISAIKLAEEKNMPYCTILFHDYQFEDKKNSDMKKWYIETINYLKGNNYEFISYRDAIKELEIKNDNHTLCK